MDDDARRELLIDDCWNKIGVHGDLSCPVLKEQVHCRNCPVFSAAASERLRGQPPIDYTNEWTRHYARPKPADQRGAQSVLIFRIGAEWLALPTTLFKEVVEVRAIHTVPHRRSGTVMGLLNVRGELLVCVALDKMLSLESGVERKGDKPGLIQQRLLVVSRAGDRIVFPVDEVRGTQRFHPLELLEAPTTISKTSAAYTKAILPWQDKSVGILDDERLFQALNRSLT